MESASERLAHDAFLQQALTIEKSPAAFGFLIHSVGLARAPKQIGLADA